jgi:hypothetical protein
VKMIFSRLLPRSSLYDSIEIYFIFFLALFHFLCILEGYTYSLEVFKRKKDFWKRINGEQWWARNWPGTWHRWPSPTTVKAWPAQAGATHMARPVGGQCVRFTGDGAAAVDGSFSETWSRQRLQHKWAWGEHTKLGGEAAGHTTLWGNGEADQAAMYDSGNDVW